MSVQKQGNFWNFRVKEYDPIKQKYIHKRIGKFKTKKEAMIAEVRHIAELDKIMNTSATLNEVFALYVKNKQYKIKDVSIYDIEKKYKLHIGKTLGKTGISKINKKVIIQWQKDLFDKGYKNSQLKNIQTLFNAIIKFAIKNEIIHMNPFDIVGFITNQNEPKLEMQYLTLDQYIKFEEYLKTDRDFGKESIMTLYYTGLRVGELQALTWKDFRDGKLFIHSTYSQKLKKISSTTKTGKTRYVLLPEKINTLLNNLKAEYKQFTDFTEDKFIFGYHNPIPLKTLHNIKNNAIKQYNNTNDDKLPIIRIHDLRHSHVSLLKNSGFTSFEIAKRVGNTEREINETYAHLFNETQQEMKDKLDLYISQK